MKIKLQFVMIFIGAMFLGKSVFSADTFTIVSFGGAYSQSQIKSYQVPYTKKNGTKFQNIDKGSAAVAGIKTQVESGKVVWDLVTVIEADGIVLCDDGAIEEIDYDKILAKGKDGSTPMKDFIPNSLSGCFIPQIIYSTVLAYNTELFPKNGPKTVQDFFDLKKFPGKRALEKSAFNNLEWALLADGVAMKDVYKVLATDKGVKRALKKLDTIKDHIIWWETASHPPQLLSDKEVAMASSYNGRFFNAIVSEKQPIKIIWDAQAFELDGWVVPKGRLTPALKKYIKFATDSQRLSNISKYISYGSTRKSSSSLVSTHAELGIQMSPHMPTAPENFKNPLKVDAIFRSENKERLAQKFNAWLAK